jgi:hypothetical protein
MGYWIVSLGLIAFGIVSALSIGLPFLLMGLAMLVLSPIRHRPLAFWPPMLGLIAYNIAFWAIAPFSCSITGTVGGGLSAATCTSPVGIRWPDDPSGLNVAPVAFAISAGIALLVGIATAALVLYWLWLDRQRRSASDHRAAPSD